MIQALLDYLYEGFYSARILAGAFMFAFFLLRRRLPVPAAAAICVAVTALTAGFNPLVKVLAENLTYDVMKIIHAFWYSGLLFILLGVLAACYKGGFSEYVYVFACGLLVECSVFGLFRLFYDVGVFELRVNTVLSVISELLFSAALYVGAFFAFRRIYRGRDISDLRGKRAMTVYFVLVIALIMFMRLNLQGVYEEVYGTDTSWVISLTLGLIPVALLALVTGAVQLGRLRGEKQVLAGMLNERERQYELSAKNIEIINRKCHDIRRHLRALEFVDGDERARSIAEIEESVSIYDASATTGNPALDTILSEKRLYCGAHGIKLTCSFGSGALSFMAPADVYVMLGNVLDNAIEAVGGVSDPEKRVITLTETEKGGIVCIREDNYFEGELVFDGSLPVTSKSEERGFHGFGVRSIKHIAEKYGGTIEVRAEGGIFSLFVTLSAFKS